MNVNLRRIMGVELNENSSCIYPYLTLNDFIEKAPSEEKIRLAQIWIAAYDFKRLSGNSDHITFLDLIFYAKDEGEKERIIKIWLEAGKAKVERESSREGCANQIQ